jgi:dipeptidyl aminopeptidase/acylaminoacyl peptidase
MCWGSDLLVKNQEGRYVMKHTAKIGIFLVLTLTTTLAAQTQSPPEFADFGQWETLSQRGVHGGFSPDGEWIVYGINRSNRENELRIIRISTGETHVAVFGSQPVYSSDSRWIAYSIGYSETEREALRDENKPVHNKLGLWNLVTGDSSYVDGIESFSFSPDGTYLVLRRYAPEQERGSSEGDGGEEDAAPGTTIIVRHLETGRDMSFGNVAQFAWQDVEDSHLLAMIISAEDKIGNGVHLFDPETHELRVLESSDSDYKNLEWRHETADLAVLRSKTDEGKDGPTQVILLWTELDGRSQLFSYDPTVDPTFPDGMRTVPYREVSWAADGKVLFFGIAEWEEKVVAEDDEEADEEETPSTDEEDQAQTPSPEEPKDPSTVEIWHWTDTFVMPWQKVHASQDRQRNMLSAWHIESGEFVQLGQDLIEERVTPIEYTELTFVAEWSKYAMERSIGRPGADLYLQDVRTGERSLLVENINDRYLEESPGGEYLLYMDDGHFWTVDLDTREITNITESAPVSFINLESDQTSKVYPDELQKPPFGVAGWTTNDADVLLYDKYDMWAVATDGSGAKRLTDGTSEEVRHRLVRPEMAVQSRWAPPSFSSREEEWVELDAPIYLSLYGEWTKKSGYGVLEPGEGVDRLVWLDQNVGSLAKAEEAEVFGYIAQDFDDSPDIFVAGPDLDDARQVTETNPFQAEYAWGHSELIEYTTDRGRRMQGALYYPAGYEPGQQYPMIVYNYELLSQNVHRYVAPSERSYYNTAVFMSQGYFVLQPDIVFRPRQPGWSVVECITAAVERVIEMGVVDPEMVGIVGHSMGGFNTSFVATHTHGVFAAAVAGAPITDLVSYYGDHHWGSGVAETDHIETGQDRQLSRVRRP